MTLARAHMPYAEFENCNARNGACLRPSLRAVLVSAFIRTAIAHANNYSLFHTYHPT
jgi:hypothetical protein